jgi:hypothetical protein
LQDAAEAGKQFAAMERAHESEDADEEQPAKRDSGVAGE